MAKDTPKSYNEIRSISEDWMLDDRNGLPYAGQSVQNFLKRTLNEKYGYIDIPVMKEDDGYYHIRCFASATDFEAWREDTEANAALLLRDVAIPISTDAGVRYSARLVVDRDTTLPIVSVTDTYNVGFRFSGVQSQDGETLNAGIGATVTVQRSANSGASWDTAGSFQLSSRDTTDTNYDTVNIGQFFGSTNPQQLRFRASFDVVDDNGDVIATAVSAWVNFASIVRTELGLQYSGAYEQPIIAASYSAFPLQYNLKGDVARTLHVKIHGATGTNEWTYAIEAGTFTNYLSEWTGVAQDDTDRYGLLTHGVRKIEAWLTCSDGTTPDAIESEHVTNELMVVTDGTDTTPRILIQNLVRETKNYVTTKMLDYAVYAPIGSEVPIVFRLTDYNDETEYMHIEVMAAARTKYSLTAAVEIENSVDDNLYAYLHIEDMEGVPYVDTVSIDVDNRDKFAPTSGASFFLNPKVRNNSETNPFQIINSATGDVVDGCVFDNFGAVNDLWMADERNNRILRVLARQRLTINWDWLLPFKSNNSANVTMEFDMVVRNITDEEQPIIDASETYGDSFIGFKMLPLEGFVFTKTQTSADNQNFGIAEDRRVHVAVNIVSALRSTADSDTTSALCRVFVNGVINREFTFSLTESEWYDRGTQIVIGQDHADIDIYSMRIYNSSLSSANILQDRTAAFSTAEEKTEFRDANDLLGGDGLINLDKCKGKGKNCLIWHGEQPYYNSNAKRRGWWEIWIYNEDGTLDRAHSGTIGKATAQLPCKGQGTSAMTYYWFNLQTKVDDLEDVDFITVAPDKIAQDYIDDELDGVAPAAPIQVPDGFFDLDGMYHGARWRLSDEHNWSTKLVNKINYASAMQSHIYGGNLLYNDLHKAIVGYNTMQLESSKARVSKPLMPFLFFVQENENAAAAFQGPCTFGPGKMDAGNLGFSKKRHTNFCMMEGADNNFVLTDFRMPWESQYIKYFVEDGEATGIQCMKADGSYEVALDLDKFVASKGTVDGEEVDVPNSVVLGRMKDFVNFFYKYDPSIKVYVGPWSGDGGFLTSEHVNDNTHKYWCTSGAEAFKLKRYHHIRQEWVDAGWDTDTETITEFNLSTVFPDAYSNNAGQWEKMNTAFIAALAAEAKTLAPSLIKVRSLQFHYCLVNSFLAGTDNCSKNTYYVLDPDTLLWEFHQDDLDTIIKTNNTGAQTKPYYIDRIFKYKEGTTTSLYEGDANALFNLEEAMYEASGENRNMYKEIFSNMAAMVKSVDNLPWIDSSQKYTPWGCMWKYFFYIQKYFPAVVYNEAARIRYEYPNSIGFRSGERKVDPLTQSIGDQLESEIQYMRRRMVLFASYAEWGDFQPSSTRSGNIGIEDVTSGFGVQAYRDVNDNNSEITFHGLVPHQYMYIGGSVGATGKYMRVRCKPGESYDFDLTGGTALGDTGCSLFASNYFRSFGNIGHLSVKPTSSYELSAKRLMDFTATVEGGGLPNFRPNSLVLNTPLIESMSINGCSLIGGALNISNCIRVQTIDMRGCDGITGVTLPQSRMLSSIQLSRNLISITARNLPNLTTLTAEGYSKFRSVDIQSNDSINASLRTFVNAMYSANPAELSSVRLTDVAWDGFTADVLMWLCGVETSVLTGTVNMSGSDRYVTFTEKLALVRKYGNIDSPTNGLYITYKVRVINSVDITGDKDLYSLRDYDMGLRVLPTSGNNVLINGDQPAIEFTLDNDAQIYAEVVDPVEGIIRVKSLSDPNVAQTFNLTVTVRLMNGSEVTSVKSLRFYRRIPEIGDFAWSDGTFDNQWDSSKSLAGLVVRKYPITDDEGNIIAYGGKVFAKENVDFKGSDGVSLGGSMPWGLYSQDEGTNGFPADMLAEVASASNLGGATDTALPNVGYGDWTSPNTVTPERFRDSNEEDGYKVYTSKGVNDFNNEDNTDTIVNHANAIITNYLDEDMPATMEELVDAMKALAEANDGANKFRQFYYPAAYGCRLYEPTLEEGATLHPMYAKGQWSLPSAGLLMRIYNFFLRSAGDVAGKSPSADYADEEERVEALMPIFANMLSRMAIANVSGKFTIPNLSTHWSSTEGNGNGAWSVGFNTGGTGGNGKYSSYVVRAVAAFRFDL